MSDDQTVLADEGRGRGRLGWVGLVPLLAAFLLVPAVVDGLTHGDFEDNFPTLEQVQRLLPGRVVEFVLVVVVISLLR